ncbi:M24 family metallopeptidase [Streptomyces sp. NPDC007162]|uniref:M24 family metallopeptidase n=1 Tax=Streptomyces sp. NPDC007162 TaxID=3156917 RepID=UPI0033D396DA
MTTPPEGLTEVPPSGLVAAQRLAVAVAEEVAAQVQAGQTEIAVRDWTEELLDARGSKGVWTPTNVGFGAGTLSCFPTDKPSDRVLWNIDLGFVDVHPVTEDGWWGDCTRSFMRGENPGYREALETMRHVHETTLAAARPGMRACDLFFAFQDALEPTGLLLLDRLNNIGHSLDRNTSYDLGYLDPWNETRLWGAWAVEPFMGNHLWGVKQEDVLWFGRHNCVVIR